MATTISRAGVLALALVAAAWFALAVRQAQDTNRASVLLGAAAPLSAQQAQRARSLLSSAGTLNPDLTVDLLRGQLAFDQHHGAAAERILESVTRREPLNLQAWTQLAFAAARSGDRATLVRAARHVSALFPKVK
jgi:predicted Zn-dependent protease